MEKFYKISLVVLSSYAWAAPELYSSISAEDRARLTAVGTISCSESASPTSGRENLLACVRSLQAAAEQRGAAVIVVHTQRSGSPTPTSVSMVATAYAEKKKAP